MEQFKQTLKSRIAIMSGLNSLAVLFIVLTGHYEFKLSGSSENISGFIDGFQLGIFLAVQIATIFFIRKYWMAIKDSQRLKELYIKDNDERNKLIRDKIGGSGFSFILCAFAVSAITAGFFNETVFFTLVSALAFLVFVKLILKIYYRSKY